MVEKEYIDLETAYDMDTLEDWYINSVSDNDTPVWTEEHLEELLNDFYVIPKDTPKVDVEPVRHGEWANEETAVTCTACGRSYDTDFEIKRNVIMNFKYCPRCGAKMDGSKVE